MKAQHEATIQFSGYPLSIVENKKTKQPELVVIKLPSDFKVCSKQNSIANDPKSWDVDWFNSYE